MEKVIDKEEAQKEYLDTLVTHRANVIKCFRLIESEIEPDLVFEVEKNIVVHDMSKYDMKEFLPYVAYFNGGSRTPEVKKNFEKAWSHHKMCNPHHWEYWLDNPDDKKSLPREMEYKYLIEMVCDWGSFAMKSKNYRELYSWYKTQDFNFAPATEKITRRTVDLLSKKLKEHFERN